MGIRALALIPARGGSKRLPGKNIKPLLGKPLIHWSIAFALELGCFDQIVVSTDSEEIAACARAAGAAVPSLRPAKLATDTATSVDVALHALDAAESDGNRFDVLALLQPTTPVRLASRWTAAFDALTTGGIDAAIGVSAVRNHPYQVFRPRADGTLLPWGDAQHLSIRSQDLPPAVVVNGSLYLVKTDVLRRDRTFFPQRTKGILCELSVENVDIDTHEDWLVAEALIRENREFG